MAAAIEIRPVSPDEFDEAVDIDDDACTLFDDVGLHFDIGREHPFAQSEYARWRAAVHAGHAYFAVCDVPVGLLVLDVVDGARSVEQLSVRRDAMRNGVGRALLGHAIAWAGGDPLWLTTYSHVPWNRAYYERHGFAVVADDDCPPALVTALDEQRRWLPAPTRRIAMRHPGRA